MVRRILLFCFLWLFMIFACEFFLATPFPDEITAQDGYLNLKEIIPETYQAQYNMKVIKDLLCISVTNNDTFNHIYLINTKDLSYILEREGTFNSLIMLEAGTGNIIIGNQKFTPAYEYIEAYSTIGTNDWGFSFGNFNYRVYTGSGRLKINVYNSNWSTYALYNTDVQLDLLNGLQSVFFSYSDANMANPYLILHFRNDSGNSKIAKVSLAALNNNPLKLTGTYPYNHEGIYLPSSDSENSYYFVDSGYIYRGWDNYVYQSYNGDERKLDNDYSTGDWLLTFDQEGKYYFWFNKTTKKLYKYLAWW